MKNIENSNKTELEKSFHSLLENKIVKVGVIVAVTLGSLYVLSKTFRIIGGTISSFKEMKNSFRN
jgi:hypothetical protein